MCCASLHLLFGALFLLAVTNVAIAGSANGTTPASMLGNVTANGTTEITEFTSPTLSPNSTDIQSNTTETESNEDTPTPPPLTEDPETNDTTTEYPVKTVPKSTTKNEISITTKKPGKPTSTVTSTQGPKNEKSNQSTYIVIIVVIILCLTGIAVYCCCQKKNRRYSVDLHPKREDAQIPLSTVDAEVFDTTSEKDLQTFTPVESTEPVKDPNPTKEAEKPEPGKETADVKQENQQNTSSTEATEIPKDKTEELTIVDLTDGDQAVSTKTSMESLDDVLNENNSNNTKAEGNGIVKEFTEISLDDQH